MPLWYRVCKKCKARRLITDFHHHPNCRGGRLPRCKDCQNKSNAECQKTRLNTPRLRIWASSCNNARRRGIEHTINQHDVPLPKVCKYLGVRIDYRCAAERGGLRSPYAPSIDRIDPSRGYVPDNIQVISDLANRMKSNANVEQLIAFARGVLRVHCPE
jgi:hypothetical protein